MDLRARRKLAFVIERYGAEEIGEAGRRTRSLAAAVAARGHDVSVLTTCSRDQADWLNDLAEGESTLDGVRVIRFLVESGSARFAQQWLSNPLVARYRWAQQAWMRAVGPVSPALEQHLHRMGALYDAVFFTGGWGPLPARGARLVRNPVLAPPPMDDPQRAMPHVSGLLRDARTLALAYSDQKDRLAVESGLPLSSDAFVVGACCEPFITSARPFAEITPVRGPFVLFVGEAGPHVDRLVKSFRSFRDAHALTPFEDDVDVAFEGRDLRLVLAGDFAHPHAPEDRIVSLGPVDDTVRRSLLQSTLAVLQCDSRLHLPVSLIEAWSLGRPTLVTDPHPALRQATRRWASEYVCESYAFASCLAALLSRRAPRAALAARTRSHARRSYEPGLVVAGLESCVEALRAPIAS